MKLSLVERETILLYNQAEPMAEVYTHDPRLMEKLELLAKKHPDQITRKDAHNFTVPKRCVSVREPYSAERRKAASERAKADVYKRQAHKSTRYYIDEMHLLLKEEQTAAYTVEIWKRFRKWGGIPTGITQNVKDLLSSREVENIFENSDFVYMLNQAGGDRQILAKQLGISPHQLSYVTHSGEGEGLLFYGSTILPFVDHFPKNTELYRIMTTKPLDLKKEDEQHDKERN